MPVELEAPLSPDLISTKEVVKYVATMVSNHIIDAEMLVDDLYTSGKNVRIHITNEAPRAIYYSAGHVHFDSDDDAIDIYFDHQVVDKFGEIDSKKTIIEETIHALQLALNPTLQTREFERDILIRQQNELRHRGDIDSELFFDQELFDEKLSYLHDFLTLTGIEIKGLDSKSLIKQFFSTNKHPEIGSFGTYLRVMLALEHSSIINCRPEHKQAIEYMQQQLQVYYAITNCTLDEYYKHYVRIGTEITQSPSFTLIKETILSTIDTLSEVELTSLMDLALCSHIDVVEKHDKICTLISDLDTNKARDAVIALIQSPTISEVQIEQIAEGLGRRIALKIRKATSEDIMAFYRHNIPKPEYSLAEKVSIIQSALSEKPSDNYDYSYKSALRNFFSQLTKEHVIPSIAVRHMRNHPLFDDLPSDPEIRKKFLSSPEFLSLQLQAIRNHIDKNKHPLESSINIGSALSQVVNNSKTFQNEDYQLLALGTANSDDTTVLSLLDRTVEKQNSRYSYSPYTIWHSAQSHLDRLMIANIPFTDLKNRLLEDCIELSRLKFELERDTQEIQLVSEPIAKLVVEMSLENHASDVSIHDGYSPVISVGGNKEGTALHTFFTNAENVLRTHGYSALRTILKATTFDEQVRIVNSFVK